MSLIATQLSSCLIVGSAQGTEGYRSTVTVNGMWGLQCKALLHTSSTQNLKAAVNRMWGLLCKAVVHRSRAQNLKAAVHTLPHTHTCAHAWAHHSWSHAFKRCALFALSAPSPSSVSASLRPAAAAAAALHWIGAPAAHTSLAAPAPQASAAHPHRLAPAAHLLAARRPPDQLARPARQACHPPAAPGPTASRPPPPRAPGTTHSGGLAPLARHCCCATSPRPRLAPQHLPSPALSAAPTTLPRHHCWQQRPLQAQGQHSALLATLRWLQFAPPVLPAPARVHACTRACVCMCVSRRVNVPASSSMWAQIRVHVCVCTCTSTHACTCKMGACCAEAPAQAWNMRCSWVHSARNLEAIVHERVMHCSLADCRITPEIHTSWSHGKCRGWVLSKPPIQHIPSYATCWVLNAKAGCAQATRMQMSSQTPSPVALCRMRRLGSHRLPLIPNTSDSPWSPDIPNTSFLTPHS